MKNGQFIAKFNHNDKVFEFILFNNRLYCICYDKEGKLISDLNEDEKNVVTSVVQSLIVDEKRSHYVRDDKVGENKYKIYIDPLTRNYFWKPLNGKDNPTDNIYLNLKYNNEPDVIYLKKINELSESELDKKLEKLYFSDFREMLNNNWITKERLYKKQRMLETGRKDMMKTIIKSSIVNLLILSTISTMVYIHLPQITELNNKNISNNNIVIESTTNKESTALAYVLEIPEINEQNDIKQLYSWERIKNAINNNPYLTTKEKEFLYELKFVFDENHQYMDLELITYRLENLRIIYNKNLYEKNSSYGGLYRTKNNEIEIFKTDSFDDVNIHIFLHEFFHVLQAPNSNHLTKELSNDLFTMEIVKRLHANDIFEKHGIRKISCTSIYQYWMNIWYNVIELLPQEDICKFQFQAEEEILYRGMCVDSSNIRQYNRACELIDIINNSENEFSFNHLPTEVIDLIAEKTNYFYEIRGKNMESNIFNQLNSQNLLSNSNMQPILNFIGKDDYIEYSDCMLAITKIQHKTYFSNTFPENIISVSFQPRGNKELSKLGNEILRDNGEFNKTYTIVVDKDFELEYSNHITTKPTKGK